MMVYVAARRCTCRAEISSAGISLFTRKLRIGWAHTSAVISSTIITATCIGVAGLGGGRVESATACCAVEVPEPLAEVPGPGSEVLGPGPTTAVPGPVVKVPVPPDPDAVGSGLGARQAAQGLRQAARGLL